jgi:hypothetical protein
MTKDLRLTSDDGAMILGRSALQEVLQCLRNMEDEPGWAPAIRKRAPMDDTANAAMYNSLHRAKEYFDADPNAIRVHVFFAHAGFALVQAILTEWLDLDWKMEPTKECPEWEANRAKWEREGL